MTLIYLGAGWLAGLALAAGGPLTWPVWLALASLPLAAALLRREARREWRLYLALGFLCLGAARYRASLPRLDAGDLATYNGRGWGTLEALVVEDPEPAGDETRLVVEVAWLTLEGEAPLPVAGRALVEAPRYPARRYGDRLLLAGRLEALPEGSYGTYLARQGIGSRVRQPLIEPLPGRGGSPLRRLLYGLKDHARTALAQMLPDPEASLLRGVLLGDDQGIPDSLMDDFRATGAAHIIAISGYNISLLSALLLTWLRHWLPRRTAGLLAMAVIVAYTVLVGADPPVVRAALMGGLLTAGSLLGRRAFGPASLMAAAMVMTAVSPTLLWEAGFQLSFAATAGLMVYAEPIQRLAMAGLERLVSAGAAARLVRLLSDSLLVTLAAQLATLPLLAWHFERISPVSPLTNLLVLPVQPPVMILGGLATLVGSVWLGLGRLLAWLCYPFCWWTIRVVEVTARLPFASLPLQLSLPGLVASALALIGLAWLCYHPDVALQLWRRLTRPVALKVGLASAGVSLLAAASFAAGLPDGRLHLTLLDVGEGEAILIETPTGRRVLVDGGPDPAVLLAHLGRRLALWERSIDLVVATHPDSAHVGGLPAVLEGYRVGALITNGAPDGPAAWQELLRLAERQAVPLVTAVRGQTISLGDGPVLEVLHPAGEPVGDYDESSVVLRLCYGEATFMLTGDAGAEVEAELIATGRPLQSVVLKAADGGDRDGTSQPFLQATDPWLVILSLGANNRDHHPAPKVLERIEALGRATGRTDLMGSLHLASDGERLWLAAD